MSDIQVTKQDLENIRANDFWTSGGEGAIFKLHNGPKNMVLKLFYDISYDMFSLPITAINRKHQKLKLLRSLPLPNYIKIGPMVYLKDQFIGYFMKEAKGFQEFGYNTFSVYQQIVFLKKLRKQLERFHQMGIIYGDLKSDNILSHYDNYKLGCFCDLDNVSIKNFSFDVTSYFTELFIEEYGKIDEKLDWYLFNLLTLETLYRLDRYSSIAYTETMRFIDSYHGKSKVLEEMKKITESYEGNLLIDEPNFYKELNIPFLK